MMGTIPIDVDQGWITLLRGRAREAVGSERDSKTDGEVG